jgi:ABC-type sugar transport system ATPase subunit
MIRFKNIIKCFRRYLVLKGMELTIEHSHCGVLVGSNGAGMEISEAQQREPSRHVG